MLTDVAVCFVVLCFADIAQVWCSNEDVGEFGEKIEKWQNSKFCRHDRRPFTMLSNFATIRISN